MKKIFVLFFSLLFLNNFYGENFSLIGKYFPNLYSTIDVFDIQENSIIYTFETNNEEKNVKYSKTYDSGLLYYILSESFPKEFNEDYYYHGIDINTNNRILILAGAEINKKSEKIERIIMFATTKSFEYPYSFIFPMFGFEVHRSYVNCSSFLKEKIKVYSVDNLCKYIVDTPWVEDVKGDGIGEGFTIVNEGNKTYPYILLMNGYISYEKPYLYKQNNRVKRIKVTGITSGKSKILEVKDTPHPQTIDISFITIPEDIRIEIADVYKGSKYEDTCIHFCVTYDKAVIPYEDTIGE